MVRLLVGAAKPLDLLQRAFKEGGGVPFTAYGADLREGQAETNRASFLQLMGTEWLSAMPDVHDRLRSSVPAHVADVGCGAGWSSIGIAQAYPNAEVYGFDMDMPSIELARANIREYNVANRVQFSVRDIATAAGDNSLAGTFDLVTAFECVHDMSDPVGALQGMRTLAGSEGAVLVVDERVPDRFSPGEERPDSEFEWMMYGWSVLHCLPVGMADDPSAGTGTVMRPNTMRSYAKDAGFRDVEVLPVENAFFRFYRLRQ
jgi:2-polyprenyl-3-methyl-5-hydroxy-6-metoxy-1,4-benzoquinol methylase